MSTKALAVKAAIKTLLEANAPTGTQVTYGLPLRAPERRWACVNDVEWDGEQWSTNRSRTETFAVAVVFNVQILAGDSLAAETAVGQMAADFEAALSAEQSLGGLAITSLFSPRALRSWPADGLYEAQFDATVTVTCRP